MGTDNNSLPELLDLRLRVQNCPKGEERKDVHVDLRINSTDIEGPDQTVISVRLHKATLELQLTGFDADPNSRFGEPLRGNELKEKQTTKVETTMEGRAKVGAGVDVTKAVPANLKLSAEAAVQAKATSTYTAKQDIAEFRVKARGGDTWEVSEPQLKTGGLKHAPLDGTYLLDDVLCNIGAQRGANLKSVSLSAYAKQRDIKLEMSKGDPWQKFTTTQQKLFSIFVTKSLGQAPGRYSGLVKLSQSEVEIED